jgi:hypothetical protein
MVFMAVLLDTHSCPCTGWALDRYLGAELALAAMRMARTIRPIRPELVHHSDHDIQGKSRSQQGVTPNKEAYDRRGEMTQSSIPRASHFCLRTKAAGEPTTGVHSNQ